MAGSARKSVAKPAPRAKAKRDIRHSPDGGHTPADKGAAATVAPPPPAAAPKPKTTGRKLANKNGSTTTTPEVRRSRSDHSRVETAPPLRKSRPDSKLPDEMKAELPRVRAGAKHQETAVRGNKVKVPRDGYVPPIGHVRDPDTGLTALEERFVIEYLRTGGMAKAAALFAYGDGIPNPSVVAHYMLRKPHVQWQIRQQRIEALLEAGVEVKRITAEMVAIAFSDPRELFDPSGDVIGPEHWNARLAAAIASFKRIPIMGTQRTTKGKVTTEREILVGFKTEVRFWDKPSMLTKLLDQLRPDLADNAKRPLVSFSFNIQRPSEQEIAEGAKRDYGPPVTVSLPVPQIHGERAIHGG